MRITLTLAAALLCLPAFGQDKPVPALTEQQQKKIMLLEMQAKQIEIDARDEREKSRTQLAEKLAEKAKESAAIRQQIQAVYAEAVGKDGKVEDFEPVLDKDLTLKLRKRPTPPADPETKK